MTLVNIWRHENNLFFGKNNTSSGFYWFCLLYALMCISVHPSKSPSIWIFVQHINVKSLKRWFNIAVFSNRCKTKIRNWLAYGVKGNRFYKSILKLYWKRDHGTGIFLRILQMFLGHLFKRDFLTTASSLWKKERDRQQELFFER